MRLRLDRRALVGGLFPLLMLVACGGGEDSGPPAYPSEPPKTKSPTSTTQAGQDASVPTVGCAPESETNPCGLAAQCGCGENETCDLLDTNGVAACVASGIVPQGRPCNDTKDCVQGLTCVYGACRPYCSVAGRSCTGKGTQLCVQGRKPGGEPIPNLAICTLGCDPRDPVPSCGSNACRWITNYYDTAVSDCNTPGPGAVGTACKDAGECQAGLTCGHHPTRGDECERWCRFGVPSDCPAPSKCVDVFGSKAPVVLGVREGLCQ